MRNVGPKRHDFFAWKLEIDCNWKPWHIVYWIENYCGLVKKGMDEISWSSKCWKFELYGSLAREQLSKAWSDVITQGLEYWILEI